MRRLRQLLARGLEHTRRLWPPIRRAYAWVHQAARILGNAAGQSAEAVRRRLDGLLGAMHRHRAKAGPLGEAVAHFLKVTRSYRPGLFHGYAVAGLPCTNNDLEQLFGVAAAFSVYLFFLLLVVTLITNRLAKATRSYAD